MKQGHRLSHFNATKHGILSKHILLQWEDKKEYTSLCKSLIEEHQPKEPTERCLVEDLEGAIWRKKRLKLAKKPPYRETYTVSHKLI